MTMRISTVPFLALMLSSLVGCGGKSKPPVATQSPTPVAAALAGDAGFNDGSRCDFRGRSDREAVETTGPGALQPNVRRVYQMVGSGDSMHKVIMCREIDTNLDGVKDIVRTYTEKGESLHEQADANYDGRVDTWITFSGGRIAKEDVDTDFDGNPDVWKYYVAGALSRIQRDMNRDSKPDRWEFYTSGKLERVGVDIDGDGHVDRWDHDELARQAAEAAESAATSSSSAAKSASALNESAGATADAGADQASTTQAGVGDGGARSSGTNGGTATKSLKK